MIINANKLKLYLAIALLILSLLFLLAFPHQLVEIRVRSPDSKFTAAIGCIRYGSIGLFNNQDVVEYKIINANELVIWDSRIKMGELNDYMGLVDRQVNYIKWNGNVGVLMYDPWGNSYGLHGNGDSFILDK